MHWSFNSDSYTYQMSYSISFVYLVILCKLVIPGMTSVSCISRHVEFNLCMEEVIYLYMQLSRHQFYVTWSDFSIGSSYGDSNFNLL